MAEILDISGWEVLYHLTYLTIAFLLALPIGWHRERSSQPVGLRTFPLVALAAAGYILVGRSVLAGNVQAEARLLQGLITGIGFLGGGVIIYQEGDLEGTATAASVWNMAALGAAVAYGRLEIAIVLSGVNFVLLILLTPAVRQMEDAQEPPLVDNEEGD